MRRCLPPSQSACGSFRGVPVWQLYSLPFSLSASRVFYFGFHYPTDVIAGVALGALIAYGMNGVALCRRLASRILPWERRSPQSFYLALFIVSFSSRPCSSAFDGLRRLRSGCSPYFSEKLSPANCRTRTGPLSCRAARCDRDFQKDHALSAGRVVC